MKYLTIAAAISLLIMPASSAMASEDAHADCDSHAKHIDHEIGAKQALEAYHVLHGDSGDDHHVIEALKKEHPDIEHELEAFVASGCTAADLDAHAHDDD